jgi:hypothetical protein
MSPEPNMADIRSRRPAGHPLIQPDVDRLLAAMRGERLDRLPNFELILDPRMVRTVLEWPADRNVMSFSLEAPDAVELARRTAQDAIVVNLAWAAGWNGSLTTMADLEQVPPPDLKAFRARFQRAVDTVQGTKIGIVMHTVCPLFHSYYAMGPIPIQSFMENLYDQPEFCARMLDVHLDAQIRILEAVQDLPCSIVYTADDLASNAGMMFPPWVIRELWEPRFARLMEVIRRFRAPVMFHCCGKLNDVLPILDRFGIEAVHPIQPACNDIYAIRAQWGRRFCLVGNMNIEGVLAFGTPDEVRRDTLEHMERLGRDGGYVVASSHSIVDAIPTENYFAMVETAVDHPSP